MNSDAMTRPAEEHKRDSGAVEPQGGDLVPRYNGGMPYGGVPQPVEANKNDATRAGQ
ncbi:hypothetical protein [Cupriavidus numazuensis]|uniref:Uncharacterized protein n=1 Tax=Cupriavidus numazuensis TaxID=221992 RepID=A0ABN7PUD9_9BURK|nr:hypothetical protein [Cupriavidus numazuensis]CAG2136130.1 hypothetical protein LMG26411_01199 [Cupriavidus numazuensis]